MYLIAAIVLIAFNAGCILLRSRLLPANWLMVISLCVFLLVAGTADGPDWSTLLTVLVLAVVAEVTRSFEKRSEDSSIRLQWRPLVVPMSASVIAYVLCVWLLPYPVIGGAAGAIAGAAAGLGIRRLVSRMRGLPADASDPLTISRAVELSIFVIQIGSLW